MNLAQIQLGDMELESHELWQLAVATAEACGLKRKPAIRLLRTTRKELLKLSVVHGEAERRARLIYPTRDHIQ